MGTRVWSKYIFYSHFEFENDVPGTTTLSKDENSTTMRTTGRGYLAKQDTHFKEGTWGVVSYRVLHRSYATNKYVIKKTWRWFWKHANYVICFPYFVFRDKHKFEKLMNVRDEFFSLSLEILNFCGWVCHKSLYSSCFKNAKNQPIWTIFAGKISLFWEFQLIFSSALSVKAVKKKVERVENKLRAQKAAADRC